MVNNKPAEVLSSNKIVLEKYDLKKSDLIYNQICKSKDTLVKQIPWLNQIEDLSAFKSYINDIGEEWERGESYRYAIFDSSKTTYIGHIGVHNIRYQSRSCSLGYWLVNDFQGKGFISESISLIEKAMFAQGFKQIEIGCFSHNLAAQKVPQMLNYKLERIVSEGQSNESLVFTKQAS